MTRILIVALDEGRAWDDGVAAILCAILAVVVALSLFLGRRR